MCYGPVAVQCTCLSSRGESLRPQRAGSRCIVCHGRRSQGVSTPTDAGEREHAEGVRKIFILSGSDMPSSCFSSTPSPSVRDIAPIELNTILSIQASHPQVHCKRASQRENTMLWHRPIGYLRPLTCRRKCTPTPHTYRRGALFAFLDQPRSGVMSWYRLPLRARCSRACRHRLTHAQPAKASKRAGGLSVARAIASLLVGSVTSRECAVPSAKNDGRASWLADRDGTHGAGQPACCRNEGRADATAADIVRGIVGHVVPQEVSSALRMKISRIL